MQRLVSFITKFINKDILRRTYYRKGQCNRCGLCCQRIYVRHKKSVIKSEDEFKKLMRLHPFYTYLEVIDNDELGLVFKCNKFDKDNKICTIHTDRPGICRRYPSEQIFSMGAMLSEDCGYYFEPIETFDMVFDKVRKNIND